MLSKMRSWLGVSNEAKLALKSTNWLMLEKLLSMPIALIVNVAIARTLGVNDLGTYSYLISLVYLVTPLTTMGLAGLVTRELVNRPDDRGLILGSSYLGRLLGGLIGFILLLAYAFIFESSTVQSWIFWLGVAQVFTTFNLIDFWFQSQVKAKYCAFARLSNIMLFSLLKLLFVYLGLSLEFFVYLYALELVGAGLLFVLFYQLKGGRVSQWKPKIRETSRLLKQSYWLILSGFAAVIYLKVDMVMLKLLAGESAVGIYAVASKLSEIWYFLPTAMVASFFPMMLSKKKESTTSYMSVLQKLSDGLLGAALVIVAFVWSLSFWVIDLLYGEAFHAAATILNIHILASIFIFMRALLSKWIIAEELLKYSLVSQGAGAFVNVLMNWWLIPEYGAEGAAWSTLISYAAASYLILWVFKRLRPMARVMTRSLFLPIRLPRLVWCKFSSAG